MKWVNIQKPIRQQMGRGTERKLDSCPQEMEKKGERRN
jgi:hypothetical protein